MAFEWINDSVTKVENLSRSLRLPISVDIFPPVANSVIDEWERRIGVPLSPSHRAFFRVTNGLNIDYRYVTEDFPGSFKRGGDQIWITPLEKIFDKTEHEKKWRDEAIADGDRPKDFWNNLIICTQTGNGPHIVLDPNNSSDSDDYRVCYAETECWPGSWRRDMVIADSFEKWVKNMFDAMVVREETPDYWQCRPFIPLIEPTLLLPSGAEHYDWFLVDSLGKPIQ